MQEITLADPFGQAIAKYSTGLECGVEIGGGTGDGSTQCFKTKELFSLEVHPDRIGRHKHNLDSRQGGLAINALSSHPMKWMGEDEVIEFYHNTNTNLNAHAIETIMGWHKEEFYVASKYVFGNIILKDKIDFLLLDGGVFSGKADLEAWLPRVKDGGFIALDDINDIKNYHNYHWFKDSNFDCVWEDRSYRNGSAIFKK